MTPDPCQLAWDAAHAAGLEPNGVVYRFKFQCPVDTAHQRSVTCIEGVDGRAVLHCDRRCEPDQLAIALGLKARELAAPPELPRTATATNGGGEPTRTGRIRNAADIAPRNARFLWYPYLPLGKVVIVAGAPGNGKSQLASLIGGLATRGALFPGDVAEPSRVLLMSAEDDADDTVIPRLLAVNADMRKVDLLDMVTEYPGGITSEGMIRLPGDSDLIHDWARSHDNARLVVMDPVASFFDRTHNAFVNQDVRDALGPLIGIAARYGITVVIILHLNKSDSKDFTAKIAESHGFQALARSVLALGPDPDDPKRDRGSRKVLAVTKANLVKPGTYGLRCEVRSVTLNAYTPPIETSELVLLGKCDVTADDLLASSSESAARLEISEWLAEVVGAGWVKVADAKKIAISDGLSWRAIDRLAREKGYKRVKVGYQGQWWLGSPRARARDMPPRENGTFTSFDEERTSNNNKETKGPVPHPVRAREEDNDISEGLDRWTADDLDEFHRYEQRKLGERDDDD